MAATTLIGLVLCLGVGALQLAQSASVHFIDSPTAQYFRATSAEQQINSRELSATLKSLLSFQNIGSLTTASSTKVDSWLSGDVFARPSAVLALQLAGVDDGQLESLTGAHSIGLAYKPAETGAASELAQTIGLVGSESSLDLARLPLDHTGLPGCGDACVEESLKAFLAQAGGNYSAGQGPMTGAVSFCTSPSSEAVILDLQAMPVRLWAVELATLYQSAGDAAKEKLRWEAQQQQPTGYITLAEATLVSMQAVKRMYGAQSAEVQTAWALLAAAASQARQALLQAHGGRVAMVVSLLGDVPKRSQPGQVGKLLAWQDAHRRRSLLADTGSSGEAHIQYFVLAAAWLSCIMLLAFAVAGCYCLSNMQFKQDSLLYPRQKAD